MARGKSREPSEDAVKPKAFRFRSTPEGLGRRVATQRERGKAFCADGEEKEGLRDDEERRGSQQSAKEGVRDVGRVVVVLRHGSQSLRGGGLHGTTFFSGYY